MQIVTAAKKKLYDNNKNIENKKIEMKNEITNVSNGKFLFKIFVTLLKDLQFCCNDEILQK